MTKRNNRILISIFTIFSLIMFSACGSSSGSSGETKKEEEIKNDPIGNTGSLDTSFANTGYKVFSDTNETTGRDIVVRDNGEIYVSGTIENTTRDILLAKYKSDGTLDTSFNTSGYNSFNNANEDNTFGGLAVDSNGDIIIGGFDSNATLIKVKSTGTLDNTFASGGIFNDSNASSKIYDIAVDSNNKIFAVGNVSSDIAIWKLDSNGSLNNSFGTNGIATYDKGATELATSIQIDKNGFIYLLGLVENKAAILKFNNDGTPNASFGNNGLVLSSVLKHNDNNNRGALKLDKDGNIFIVFTSTSLDLTLLKYKSNGSIDTSFGSNGIVTHNGAGNSSNTTNPDYANDIVIDEYGYIYITGHSDTSAATESYNTVIWKFKKDGTPDTNFDGDGIVTGNAFAGNNSGIDAAYSLTLDKNNKLYQIGFSQNSTPKNRLVIVRYK